MPCLLLLSLASFKSAETCQLIHIISIFTSHSPLDSKKYIYYIILLYSICFSFNFKTIPLQCLLLIINNWAPLYISSISGIKFASNNWTVYKRAATNTTAVEESKQSIRVTVRAWITRGVIFEGAKILCGLSFSSSCTHAVTIKFFRGFWYRECHVNKHSI